MTKFTKGVGSYAEIPQSDPPYTRLGHGNAHGQGSGGEGRRGGFASLLGQAPGV